MTDRNDRVDFEPAARALEALLPGVTDDQLTSPTPCARWMVGDLLDHLMGLTVAFRTAAEKGSDAAPGGPGDPSVANLDPRWRSRLPVRLDELVAAWRAPGAWTGETAAGGVVLPAEIMGIVALNELVVHGWDLASATGQSYDVDHRTVETVHRLVSQQASSDGTPGLFGPSITRPAGASLLDQVLGLTGRDPGWKP
ncbi:TIGR03086 family metal-binding protein [Micromonospora sp. C28SCA-DRY-2]|uniref:TIGR03086 family metal-binding protein n=1 Tax=Micromonospora sp. C28SCA-DRY-2 TaxID=3059522 RepID=UPI0026760C02|nr:TIGR03086 family metal-binding protein [Micromonospora sp. C28SCA-DRY-2]MDO3700187.1 TIGR03086 family metal-binding protein [Micromonospora sp. C28SCA-DRY-2]